MRLSALAFAVTLLPWLVHAQPLDLVFVLDTTGSMSGEIRESKQRIGDLADALKQSRPGQRVRVGVVAYRDKGDAYLTQVSPLSDNISVTHRFLSSLDAGGGGDTPEDVLAALDAALHRLEWSTDPKHERQIFVIADAPPHLDYSDRPTLEALLDEAIRRRIVINVIGCRSLDSSGVQLFRKLAYANEGSYQHIGRVQTGGGLAEAMLSSLTPESAPEDLSRLPTVRVRLDRELASAPGSSGVAVTPWSEGSGRMRRCGLQLEIPIGYDLVGVPEVKLGHDAWHVQLALRAGQGRKQRYSLETCAGPATPIRVRFGG